MQGHYVAQCDANIEGMHAIAKHAYGRPDRVVKQHKMQRWHKHMQSLLPVHPCWFRLHTKLAAIWSKEQQNQAVPLVEKLMQTHDG